MAKGIEGFESELGAQRNVVAEREPVYARLFEELGRLLDGELGAQLAASWAEREFHTFYERPLLLAAGLRYEALLEGSSHPLYEALAAPVPKVEAVTREAVQQATAKQRARLYTVLRERYVQTNETSRAVAWLLPAHLLVRAGERRRLALVDLGTSAGLNLIADELPPLWRDQDGRAIAVDPRPEVALRLGLDRFPLDVRDEDTAAWLRACVWPSDRPRLERLELGIARFRAGSESAPRLERVPLQDCAEHLRGLPAPLLALCVQTIVRDYMPEPERVRYERVLQDFLSARPLGALLCELELHPDGGAMEQAAALTVHFVDREGRAQRLVLARTHPHPKILHLDPEAEAKLIEAFGVSS